MKKRSIVIATVAAAGLLVGQVAPLGADSEGGPPATGGEPAKFDDGGTTKQVEDDGAASAAAIVTSSSAYDPTTLTKFIPGSALVVGSIDNGDVADTADGDACVNPDSSSTGGLTEGFLPVELPDGALLTGATFFGYDKDPANDMTFRIKRSTLTFPGSFSGSNSQSGTQIASGDSSVWGDTVDASSTFVDVDPDEATGSAGSFLFGTSHRFYVLEIEMDNASGVDQRFCGAEVFYRVPTTGDNQTFTPLEPCAIFDSRPGQGGTGAFAGEEERTVTVTGDTSAQGGAGDCGINPAATSIAVNMLVLSPTGTGTLKVWAAGGTEPNGLLAYTNQVPRWNSSSVVPISSGDQITIKTQNNGADVYLAVTGYYSSVSNMGN